MSELPKTFDPTSIEARWYAHWEDRGLFWPERPDATPWTGADAEQAAWLYGKLAPPTRALFDLFICSFKIPRSY